MFRFILFVVICGLISNVSGKAFTGQDGKTVMPWMCLERCGMNSSGIEASLKQISANLDTINAVSFEMFNLGDNSTLITNNLTNPLPTLQTFDVETYAMVSSYPYPADFIYWMRHLFANPQPFIDATISAGLSLNLTGFNSDFEPIGDDITAQDATDYAAFLTTWQTALAANGMKLSVDTATWSILWDLQALAECSVDTVISMSTYTDNNTLFAGALEHYAANIPVDKLGIGMETDLRAFNATDLDLRFNLVENYQITQIDIWLMPIPENWFPYLKKWVQTPLLN